MTPEPPPGAEATTDDQQRRSIVQNATDLMSSQAITWVLATVLTIVQPRFLGPEGQGQLRLAYSVWLIVDVLVALGTSTSLTLAVAKDRERGLAMVRPILTIRAIGYVFSWAVVAGYLAVSNADSTQVAVIILIGVVSMFGSVAGTARSALLGLEHMRYPAMADVLTKVVAVVAVVTVLIAGGDVVLVAAVSVVASLLNAVLMVRFLRRFPRPDWHQTMRYVIGVSAALMVADAALILYQQVDTVVMSLLVGDEALGWYATADQLFGSLLFVPTILVTTLFPVFGRLHQEDPGRLRHVISRAMASVLLVTVPIGLGAVAVGPPLARFLFGDEFEGAGEVLMVLGVVLIITSETILVGRYAIATGHQRLWNAVMVGAVVMTIPLDIALVPWTDDRFGNGAIGGALAYVVTESLMLTIGLVKFGPQVLSSAIVSRIGRTFAAGLVMLGAVWPLRDEPLIVPLAVGGIVYVVAVVVVRALGPEERRAIERFAAVARSRFGSGG